MDFIAASPDIPLKQFWRDNERFASLFNDILFEGSAYVKPDCLTEMDTEVSASIISKESQHVLKRTRDIVKMSSDGTAYQIMGIENQQAIHYAMPLRTLTYETLSYIRQVEDRTKELKKTKEYSSAGEFLSGWKKEDRLKPCYTLVIYWGKERWDGPRSLADMMDFGSEQKIREKFWGYPAMNLICVNEMDGAKLGKLQNEEVHDVFDTVHKVYQKEGKRLSESLGDVSFAVAYVAAAVTGTMKQFGTVLKETRESGKESVDMGGALDEFLQREHNKSKLEGKQEGELEAKKSSSLNMLKRGFDYRTIAEINEVTVDQVKAWEKENNSPS